MVATLSTPSLCKKQEALSNDVVVMMRHYIYIGPQETAFEIFT